MHDYQLPRLKTSKSILADYHEYVYSTLIKNLTINSLSWELFQNVFGSTKCT